MQGKAIIAEGYAERLALRLQRGHICEMGIELIVMFGYVATRGGVGRGNTLVPIVAEWTSRTPKSRQGPFKAIRY